MDVTITIDLGQDYRVSMTTHDARALYDKLGAIFSPINHTTLPTWRGVSTSGLDFSQGSSTSTNADVPLTYTISSKVEDQASPTEATGTLREDNHICSLNCSCFRSHI